MCSPARVGQAAGAVFRTVDDGTTWLQGFSGLSTNMTVYNLDDANGVLYASTSTALMKSSDLGQTWVQAGDLELRCVRRPSRREPACRDLRAWCSLLHERWAVVDEQYQLSRSDPSGRFGADRVRQQVLGDHEIQQLGLLSFLGQRCNVECVQYRLRCCGCLLPRRIPRQWQQPVHRLLVRQLFHSGYHHRGQR